MEADATAGKGKTKLREFRRIELLMQRQWSDQHIFESDAQIAKEYLILLLLLFKNVLWVPCIIFI